MSERVVIPVPPNTQDGDRVVAFIYCTVCGARGAYERGYAGGSAAAPCGHVVIPDDWGYVEVDSEED